MKSEDHIHFLSELIYELDQLLAFVRDYCDQIVNSEEEEPWHTNSHEHENMPF